MASVVALLAEPGPLAAGAVLPIDHFLFSEDEDRSDEEARTALSRGGALYLVAQGPKHELWLIAVLEAPECSGIMRGDKRKPGWYAPANTTPITDISKLRRKLGLGARSRLAEVLEAPTVLEPAAERAIRELLGEEDAPVIASGGAAETNVAAIEGPPLARAAAHLAASFVVPAIEAMLEAWRISRVPQLADLIDRATRVTREYDRPLLTARRDDDDRAQEEIWNTTFDTNRAAAMPQLLQNVHAGSSFGLAAAFVGRFEKLATLDDDPRIAVRLLEQPTYAPSHSIEEYWSPIFKVVERTRDIRLLPSFTELAYEIEQCKAKKLALLAENPARVFKRWPLELAADEVAHVRAIEAELERLEEPVRTAHSLVDAIAENPKDDAAWQIYADWLLESGHPRGEYISLATQQARGRISPGSARRLAALVEVPFLFGTLDDLATTSQRPRDRGIDRSLSVYWASSSLAWKAASFNPLARAIETIEMIGNPKPHREPGIAAFVRAAPRLRTIENVEPAEGRELVKLLGKQFRYDKAKLVRVGR